MRRELNNAALALLLVLGCASSPKINVGDNPDGSVAGSGGASGAGGLGGYGGGDNSLVATITEPPSELAIQVVTLSCAGACKQVLAVARGGNAPYTFEWSDGVTTAAREICASDDTTFTVTVEDTAVTEGEFLYTGQSTVGSLTAHVLDCSSDGGLCTQPQFTSTPESGVYTGPGTYVCTDGNMPVPNLTLTLDLNIDRATGTQTGTLYFQWGLAVIVATSDLPGELDCATGTLNATVENGLWGVPGLEPMSVLATGTFIGEVVAASDGNGAIAGTFHWVSHNFDGSLSNDCLVTYSATRTP